MYFVLRWLGYSDVSNYDGSFLEWSSDNSLPVNYLENYDKLVPPEWVKDLIKDKKLDPYNGKKFVVLETEYGKSKKHGSIPGAVKVHPCCFESENDVSKYYPKYSKPDDGNLLPDGKLHKAISNLGISSETTVIVYGKGIIIPMTSCRIVWALMYAGVKDVRILNGG